MNPPLLDTKAAISELPQEDGYLSILKNNLFAIARRVHPLDVLLIEFIACRTTSARKQYKGGPRPKFAQIPMDDYQSFTGAKPRTISLRLAHLEKVGYIERQISGNTSHRGGVRNLPQNFRKLDLPAPKPKRCAPRSAEQRGPRPQAALEQRIAEPSVEEKIGRMVLQSIAESGRMPLAIEVATAHGVALPQAAQSDTQSRGASVGSSAPTITESLPRNTEVRQAPAEVLPEFVAWAAANCTMRDACPFVHGQLEASLTEAEAKTESGEEKIVCLSVGEPGAHASRHTETVPIPEQDPEGGEPPDLIAIRSAVEETKIHEHLLQPITKSHLVKWQAALRGAPAKLLAQKILRRWDRIAALGLIVELARDVGKIWTDAQAKQAKAQPPPSMPEEQNRTSDERFDEWVAETEKEFNARMARHEKEKG